MNPRWAAVVLVTLGLTRMVADLAGWGRLAGVAAATGASPAPKVFSVSRGLETFSSRFSVEWNGANGTPTQVRLSPERYAGVRGPYNRRNIYGAAVAYGPVLAANPLTRPMFEAVARYGLCGKRPLLAELGVDVDAVADPLRVRVEPAHPVPDLDLVLEAPCP
jgi:hypothetical protein